MKNKLPEPALFVPLCPDDFIGPAGDVARILEAKANAIREERGTLLKCVITGPPGIGKTRLAEFLAGQLTGEKIVKGQSFHCESVNGRNVDLALIRRWQSESHYVPTTWVCRIVNELDTSNQVSQDLLLTYLDEIASRVAFIGTSNLKLVDMDQRFQTRLQHYSVKAPNTDAITRLLRRFKVAPAIANMTAVGSGGNVRAALLDAQTFMDGQLV